MSVKIYVQAAYVQRLNIYSGASLIQVKFIFNETVTIEM